MFNVLCADSTLIYLSHVQYAIGITDSISIMGHVHQQLKNPLVGLWPNPLTFAMGRAYSPAACSRPVPILMLPIVPTGILLTEFVLYRTAM